MNQRSSFLSLLSLFLWRRWPETLLWAVLSDLPTRPRRAWLRYRFGRKKLRMRQAFAERDYDRVQELALSGLQMTSQVGQHPIKEEGMYYCHQYLGLVHSQRGQLDQAGYHLKESAKIEGTLLLRASTPSMRLARSLVESKQTDPVLEYLEELQRWWVCDAPLGERTRAERRQLVLGWMRKVRRGQVPDGRTWRTFGD